MSSIPSHGICMPGSERSLAMHDSKVSASPAGAGTALRHDAEACYLSDSRLHSLIRSRRYDNLADLFV